MSASIMKKSTRTIIDGGGYPREMTLLYESHGVTIYSEPDTGIIAAFGDYDSKDESAVWAEDLADLVDHYPTFADEVAEINRVNEKTYDYRDIARSSWIADLYRHRDETRFPDIDPTCMSAEDVQTLADYLRADDGSLSVGDQEFSEGAANQVEALLDA